MVTPSSRSLRTISHMSRRSSTSTPADGSSRNRMSGSWLSALAIITRRFIPPESCIIIDLRLSHSERRLSKSSIRLGSRGRPNRPREKLTVDHTVSKASVVNSWGTSPIRVRASRNAVCQLRPSTRISPPLGLTIPQVMLMSVVLPAPLGPSKAKISPLRMSRSTALSALTPPAYSLVRPRMDRIGSLIRRGSVPKLRSIPQGRARGAATSACWRRRK